MLGLLSFIGIYEAGHTAGLLTCSKYGHHRHLPLGLIQWYDL